MLLAKEGAASIRYYEPISGEHEKQAYLNKLGHCCPN
jgi:hypothetical protein